MKLTQRQRDDLACFVRGIAMITEPYLSDYEIADYLSTYIGDEEYQWLKGELDADHDGMDAFR